MRARTRLIHRLRPGRLDGYPQLELWHIRDLLTTRGRLGAAGARLACYGGGGFTADLLQAADQDDEVILVSVEGLYRPGGYGRPLTT